MERKDDLTDDLSPINDKFDDLTEETLAFFEPEELQEGSSSQEPHQPPPTDDQPELIINAAEEPHQPPPTDDQAELIKNATGGSSSSSQEPPPTDDQAELIKNAAGGSSSSQEPPLPPIKNQELIKINAKEEAAGGSSSQTDDQHNLKEEAGGSLKRHHQDLNITEYEVGSSSETMKQKVAVAVDKERVIMSEEDFLNHITKELNGLDIKPVIEKALFASDLNSKLGRLNIPVKKVKDDSFLRAQEMETLDEITPNKKKKGSITVGLVGPSLVKKECEFSKWNQSKTQNYVLKKGWNKFVQENSDVLKPKATIRLYSFREANGALCFGLNLVEQPQTQEEKEEDKEQKEEEEEDEEE